MAVLAEDAEPVRDLVDPGQVEPVPAVAVGGDPAQCRVAVATEHDRQAAIAGRLRIDPDGLEVDEAALERGRIAVPELPHRSDVLNRAGAAAREGDAEGRELLLGPADADAERETTPGHGVQTGRLLGHEDGVVLGQEHDPGGDLDPLRRRGCEAQAHERVQPIGIRGHRKLAGIVVGIARGGTVDHDDVLARPQPGKPGRLGGAGDGGYDRGAGARADAQSMQADADHWVARTPSAIAVATTSVATTSTASYGALAAPVARQKIVSPSYIVCAGRIARAIPS